ncbi:thioredoxin [Streptomonospora nanhaiensis]|uniref:Thioredoxin n=1 Tax=Streptomonospora nanhaiensis TaxID=1323731 RepID=A0A853BQ51_9ACTN|nr:thioredoxin [Streptomonospora nanhaiensis]MBV2366694.1 thioredoxin [Streptomonospora nanhaiensis]MBX9387637.1 thioredoxin [Streptomonospora nanhaiensis]NYI97130.1 thioredoxin 1 [Streptomonospora nanhaiensis]
MPQTSVSGRVTAVTDAEFEERVLNADGPVLVDFWAEWCPPCHMIAPVLEEIAAERADSLTVVKVNSDENPLTAREYQVMSLPTLMLFRGGHPERVLVGARPKARLLADLVDAQER